MEEGEALGGGELVRVWVGDEDGCGGENLVAALEGFVGDEAAAFAGEVVLDEGRVGVVICSREGFGACEGVFLEHGVGEGLGGEDEDAAS